MKRVGEPPEGLGLAPVSEDEVVVEVAPVKEPTTSREWVLRNLFPTPLSGLLTVLTATLVGYLGYRFVRWVLVTADWQVIRTNLRVYMVGRFPIDQLWRVWASGYVVILLAGLSWGVSELRLTWTPRRAAVRFVLAGLFVGALVYLLDGARIWLLIGSAVLVYATGVAAGRRGGGPLRVPLGVGWALAFPAVILLLRAFGGVPPRLWGGFLLNMLVAVVGIFLSFPIGVLLALGRRGSLPAIRLFCVGVIELVRGVPLVTLIIAGQFILPLMLPPGLTLVTIVRMMLVFTLFSAAYVAEIVRGGLQGVPAGQYEAARSLGLSAPRMMALIILPQALRSTIPAMISHFISLFKDTSLLAALAITELLQAGRQASAQLDFIGKQKEALLAAALIFWVVAFSMSRWSQRLERRLGVGER
ncbi:MAG: amino acid ABC transporter permease [Actinomycetota bacterium]